MPVRYRRNTLRYPGYDYAQAGAYLVTITTHGNAHWFGTVKDGTVSLSPQGEAVANAWLALEQRFSGIRLDDHIVMPNHVHGIVMLGADPGIPKEGLTLGIIINSFKNSVLAAWRHGVEHSGWPRYEQPLWHRDFHDRIIRNDAELDAYRDYIRGNPARWSDKRGC